MPTDWKFLFDSNTVKLNFSIQHVKQLKFDEDVYNGISMKVDCNASHSITVDEESLTNTM